MQKKTSNIIGDNNKSKITEISNVYEKAIIRLTNEIEVLTKRARWNLIYGSVIALSGIGLLGNFVLNEIYTVENWNGFIFHLLPKISFVLIVEFFAVFFLKLHSNALTEIKYFQNELTNLDARYSAMIMANTSGKEMDISNSISEFLKVERNFKLSKDETTVELEKQKMDADTIKEMLSALISNNKSK